MKVIVVEDEPLIRKDLCFMLEHSGVEVLGEGKDGFDAVNLCKKHHPDVAILDVNLPELDGITASKVIKKEGLSRAVVLVTAYSEEIFIDRAGKAGVDGYLVKPVDARMLLPTIKIALSKADEQAKIVQELHATTKKLESRKTIEKAKGALMQHEHFTEQEAYGKMRSLSMQKNCSLEEVSAILLLTYEDEK